METATSMAFNGDWIISWRSINGFEPQYRDRTTMCRGWSAPDTSCWQEEPLPSCFVFLPGSIQLANARDSRLDLPWAQPAELPLEQTVTRALLDEATGSASCTRRGPHKRFRSGQEAVCLLQKWPAVLYGHHPPLRSHAPVLMALLDAGSRLPILLILKLLCHLHVILHQTVALDIRCQVVLNCIGDMNIHHEAAGECITVEGNRCTRFGEVYRGRELK